MNTKVKQWKLCYSCFRDVGASVLNKLTNFLSVFVNCSQTQRFHRKIFRYQALIDLCSLSCLKTSHCWIHISQIFTGAFQTFTTKEIWLTLISKCLFDGDYFLHRFPAYASLDVFSRFLREIFALASLGFPLGLSGCFGRWRLILEVQHTATCLSSL